MEKSISIKPPVIASIVMLLLAILPLPYGYYILLKLVVCFTALFLAWFSYKRKRIRWMWVMGFLALIFNPVIPLYFGREFWIFVDLITVLIFVIFLKKFKT